jgi:hypothetical protein
MLKLAFATILMTGLVSVGPVFADTNNGSGNSGIGRGCTLDPFTHTMRCIDFDNCTTDKNGKKTCPVVVTPTKAEASSGGKKGDKQQYLVVKMENVMVTGY